jgi:hypothetical protein
MGYFEMNLNMAIAFKVKVSYNFVILSLTLLETPLFATNHYVTGMQLVVICNYKFGIV